MLTKYAPVFVVCPVRSGSTLLHLMLDAHPLISNPGECDFLFDQISNTGAYPDLYGYQQWLATNRFFLAKGLYQDKELSFPDLIDSFIQQMTVDRKILTMNIHRHFDRVPFLCRDARYIHLLRDPRDVARSCIGMGWCGNVYYGVDVWLEAERSWGLLKPSLRDDQYLEVKYEELMEDVEAGLTKICRFLGVDYSKNMLEYMYYSTYSLPDKDLIYQWQKKYSKRELQLVEGKVGDMLVDRGYAPSNFEPTSPGFFERIHLAFDNKKYRVEFGIRKYGFVLYLKWLIAQKIGCIPIPWRGQVQRRINEIDVQGLK